MTRPAIALVTGYTRNAELLSQSMAPLAALKRSGVLKRVLYVTWDTPELEPYLAPLSAFPEIELVRVTEPKPSGTPYQKGVVYQVKNLEAGLAPIEDDALVLKTRPDFVARAEFLERKLSQFDAWSAPSLFPDYETLGLPAPAFERKLWLAWADANQPFFYEDAAFIGLKSDMQKLVTPQVGDKISPLATKTNTHGPFAHVVRFASIFRADYPVFARYLREYKYYVNDMDYRRVLVTELMKEAFFWHMLAGHAWILAKNFHIDCGTQGDLKLYPNIHNANADWSNLASLRVNPPFDKIEQWRTSVVPGNMVSGIARLYGRLVDDFWQHALFTNPAGVTREQMTTMLRSIAQYAKGGLSDGENAFYRTLASVHKKHFLKAA